MTLTNDYSVFNLTTILFLRGGLYTNYFISLVERSSNLLTISKYPNTTSAVLVLTQYINPAFDSLQSTTLHNNTIC